MRVITSDGRFHLDDATKEAWQSLEKNITQSANCLLKGALVSLYDLLFRVVSRCSQIGRISCMTATLETSQDPPYEASEHCEDTSQLVGSKRWIFRGVVA